MTQTSPENRHPKTWSSCMSSPGDADDNTVGVRAINGDAQEPLAARAAQGSCEDGPLKAESRAPQGPSHKDLIVFFCV